MTKQETLEAFKNLYDDIDKDNWLINPEMIQIAIDAIDMEILKEELNG